MPEPAPEPAIEADGVAVHFPNRGGGAVCAVAGVSLRVAQGAFHGIIGESGCGKTTLARVMVGLQQPTAGSVCVAGRDGGAWRRADRLGFARAVQFVFQEPLGAMSRRQTVRQTLEEPLPIHGVGPEAARAARIEALPALVALPASEPRILICDEPLSALDVSIRAQVVNLFMDLRRRLDLTVVMVAHDLAVVREIRTEVTVMYLGQVVEEGAAGALFDAPAHPYTQALLSAAPSIDPRIEAARRRILLPGDPPSPSAVPPGCRFHTRCPVAELRCATLAPDLRPVGHGGRARCRLADATHAPVI